MSRTLCSALAVHRRSGSVTSSDFAVVVVPRNLAVDTAAKAQKRHDDEDGKRQRLAAGELSLDVYRMREGLAKAGLVYADNPEDV